MIRILSPLFFLFALLNADDVVLERVFKNFNIKGTLVIATLKSDKLYVYNQKKQICDSVPLQLLKYPIL